MSLIKDLFDFILKEPKPNKEKCLIKEYYKEELDEDFDPYEETGWGDIWHCIRCGSKLQRIKDEAALKIMRKSNTVEYLCSNDKCCHRHAPLRLHNPVSIDSAAGESYSISWIR